MSHDIFLSNREIHERGACGIVPQAKERLLIATVDINDVYLILVDGTWGRFLEVLDGVVKFGGMTSTAILIFCGGL